MVLLPAKTARKSNPCNQFMLYLPVVKQFLSAHFMASTLLKGGGFFYAYYLSQAL
jgi:hypothetical protein